jgi:hypothetical protein
MARSRITSVHDAGDIDDKAADASLAHVRTPADINQLLADPLHDLKGPHIPSQEVFEDGHKVARQLGLDDETCSLFGKGALLAVHEQSALYTHSDSFSDEDRIAIVQEEEHPWKAIPKTLYMVVILSSLCAAVQGMDETVVNGAQIFYAKQFGIKEDPWILGLVNSAPYLACAVAGCWLSIPLNKWIGRKGTIIATCICDICCCIGQGCVNSKSSLPFGDPKLTLRRLANHARSSPGSRLRYWLQVCHCACLHRRVCPCSSSRCLDHAVADVDCLRYYDRFRI